MDKALKPIGSEFSFDFPPSPNCTETRGRRIKYKVIGHTLAVNPETRQEELMEELKAIDSEYIDAYNKEGHHEKTISNAYVGFIASVLLCI